MDQAVERAQERKYYDRAWGRGRSRHFKPAGTFPRRLAESGAPFGK